MIYQLLSVLVFSNCVCIQKTIELRFKFLWKDNFTYTNYWTVIQAMKFEKVLCRSLLLDLPVYSHFQVTWITQVTYCNGSRLSSSVVRKHILKTYWANLKSRVLGNQGRNQGLKTDEAGGWGVQAKPPGNFF